jgi:hypothetical protein
MPALLSAADAIDEAAKNLEGQPVFLAGSAVAADEHGLPFGWSDVDLFVPSQQVLISVVQSLLDRGYVMDDRFSRVWYRWLRYGMKGWHTNSMRLESLGGVETNVVYKLVDGHPTTSLSQVLESFDFGLLGMGYTLEDGTFRDLRPYLFPGYDPKGPLPMMPARRDNWRQGFISTYNGLREGARFGKYSGYGYDLSLVRDDLMMGYQMAALYLENHVKSEKRELGRIYRVILDKLAAHEDDELIAAYKQIDFNDPLAEILEALE